MFNVGLMTLAEAYQMRVELNNHIETYEKEARKVLDAGGTHPDFTLKQGNIKRTWKDTENLIQELKDKGYTNKDLYDVKFKGIPAITKLAELSDIDTDPYITIGRQKDTMIYTGSKK